MPTSFKRPLRVHVTRRNLRWEVSADGTTRPLIDWLATRERAIEHAVARALELDAERLSQVDVVIERSDGSVEQVIHGRDLARGEDREEEGALADVDA